MTESPFTYEVYANVTFTTEEVENMMTCSREHYDGRCQHASTEVGFLYRLQRRMSNAMADETPSPSTLSGDQVDTLCKILEGFLADKKLYWSMRRLLLTMNLESERLHESRH